MLLKNYWICLLSLLILLPACQQDKSLLNGTSGAPVILYTSPLVTKASLSGFNNTPIHMLRGTSSENYTELWPAVAGSDGTIRFVPIRFYPFNDEDIYLRGFYPTPIEKVEGGRNLYTFDISKGDVDLISSNELRGSYYNQISATQKMSFEHHLSQIQFSFFTDGSFPMYRRIYEVWLHGAHDTVQINLSTRDLTFSGLDSIRVYNYKDDPVNAEKGFLVPINTPVEAGQPAMFEPEREIKMSIVFDTGRTNRYSINFNRANNHPENISRAGYSYKVQFLLTAISLNPEISIIPWASVSSPATDMGTIW